MSSSPVKKINTPIISDPLVLAGRAFSSRLLVGTGKYASAEIARAAVRASGAEIITMALRRVSLSSNAPSLMEVLSPENYTYLPNSAGCYTAEEALRTLRLAREIGGWNMVKLEVIGDKKTLYPDMKETLKATRLLVKDGFNVMAYVLPEAPLCKQIEEEGAAAIMPLAAPIGSGRGIESPETIQAIVAQSRIPVLVDAGIGTASDATIAMELGCDGVLMNTAIAKAGNPVEMAEAMKYAVIAGRKAFLAKRMPKRDTAESSSPQEGVI